MSHDKCCNRTDSRAEERDDGPNLSFGIRSSHSDKIHSACTNRYRRSDAIDRLSTDRQGRVPTPGRPRSSSTRWKSFSILHFEDFQRESERWPPVDRKISQECALLTFSPSRKFIQERLNKRKSSSRRAETKKTKEREIKASIPRCSCSGSIG